MSAVHDAAGALSVASIAGMTDDPKLSPPRVRRRLVRRARLVDRLTACEGPLVTVVAPAGYGKSTVLAQWTQTDPRPSVWVNLDTLDNDPAVLLEWLAAAFGRLPGAGTALRGRLTVRRVATMLRDGRPPIVVLDDAHLVRDLEAIDTVTGLLPYLPDGAVLAFAGRTQPINLGRLRVELDPLELGPEDLAMDDEETYAALLAQGAPVGQDDARFVHERTGGWPAVVTLAASAARRGVDLATAASGDERVVAEYLHSEVMARLDRETVSFLRQSAVLDRLTGSACDAVLERTGSVELLGSLAVDHQLVLPVGTGRGRYRYHPLLRDLLIAELSRADPPALERLRRRAAGWSVTTGDLWAAVQYFYDAGDTDEVAHLILALAQPSWALGHAITVQRWLERLETAGVLDAHPEVAAVWGVLLTLEGRDVEAERWAEKALTQESHCQLGEGAPPFEALRAMLVALRCVDGPEQMRADAERLVSLVPPSHPFAATGLALAGMAVLLLDDPEGAARRLQDGAELAEHLGSSGAQIGALGILALIRADQQRWDEARELAATGLRRITAAGFEEYGLSGIVLAAAARVGDHDGDEKARLSAIARYDALRPRMTHAMPHLAVQGRLTVASVHRSNGDWEAARTLASEMAEILARRPRLGRLVADVATFTASLGDRRGGGAGGSTLTVAELRLLPLLPTHLSFRGIGERLFLSQHTVKSQALSIYRKLGASTRDQAVTTARELGLLTD